MSVFEIYKKDGGAKFMRPIHTREDYLNCRNTERQRQTLKTVREQDATKKHLLIQMNYSCLPNPDGSLKGSKTASRSVGMDIDWTPSPLPHEGEEQIAARKEEWLRKVPDLDRAYSIAFPKSTPLNVNKKKRIRERCTC